MCTTSPSRPTSNGGRCVWTTEPFEVETPAISQVAPSSAIAAPKLPVNQRASAGHGCVCQSASVCFVRRTPCTNA